MSRVQFYRDNHLPFFELKQCTTGELSYKRHAHEEYSFGIVEQGKSSFWYEGKIAEIFPQTMVFLPPDLIHSCNPVHASRWEYKMLFINAEWVQGFRNSQGRFLFRDPIVKAASVHDTFHTVGKLIESLRSNVSPLEKEASIVALFEQQLKSKTKNSNANVCQDQTKLEVIREYLHSCFLEKVTLDQLERASGLNKFHIIRLFKQYFKIPPHTYQTLLRVNYAKKELRNHRPLAEVALAAGFYDQSHFCKVFKDYTGVTPDKYQKLI